MFNIKNKQQTNTKNLDQTIIEELDYDLKHDIGNAVGVMIYYHSPGLVHHLNTTFHNEFKFKFKIFHFDGLHTRLDIGKDFENHPIATKFMKTLSILFKDPEIGINHKDVLGLKQKYQGTIIDDFIEGCFLIYYEYINTKNYGNIDHFQTNTINNTMPKSFKESFLKPREWVEGGYDESE